PQTPEWDEQQRLAAEKEVLGFFITGHPLEKYQSKLEDFRSLNTEAIAALKHSTGKDEIYSAGIITNLRVLKSKKGDYAGGINLIFSGGMFERRNGFGVQGAEEMRFIPPA